MSLSLTTHTAPFLHGNGCGSVVRQGSVHPSGADRVGANHTHRALETVRESVVWIGMSMHSKAWPGTSTHRSSVRCPKVAVRHGEECHAWRWSGLAVPIPAHQTNPPAANHRWKLLIMENTTEITNEEMSPSPWERTLIAMRDQGLEYGATFPIEWLERSLMAHRESIAFGVAIYNINDSIGIFGFYLSARDQRSTQYIISAPLATVNIAEARVRRGFAEIRRARDLFRGLAENPKTNFDDHQRQLLRKQEEKNATRLALMKAPLTMFRKASKQQKQIA